MLTLALLAGLLAGRGAPAATVLYNASVDSSIGTGNPASVPYNGVSGFLAYQIVPPVSSGVTINPNPALLAGSRTGALNGTTYGQASSNGSTTGTTGFAHVSFTIGSTGLYQLTWEVCGALDTTRQSALAIDNVRLGSNLLYGFESGIPAGFTSLGTVGTSPAITGLMPTEGSRFAFLDTSGKIAPILNTGPDGAIATTGSRLVSSSFTASSGQVLSLDLAFLTNDQDPFDDYAIAVLAPAATVVPEPRSLILFATAVVALAGTLWLHRRFRA
jgi:hypothetical protein